MIRLCLKDAQGLKVGLALVLFLEKGKEKKKAGHRTLSVLCKGCWSYWSVLCRLQWVGQTFLDSQVINLNILVIPWLFPVIPPWDSHLCPQPKCFRQPLDGLSWNLQYSHLNVNFPSTIVALCLVLTCACSHTKCWGLHDIIWWNSSNGLATVSTCLMHACKPVFLQLPRPAGTGHYSCSRHTLPTRDRAALSKEFQGPYWYLLLPVSGSYRYRMSLSFFCLTISFHPHPPSQSSPLQ